MYFSSKTIFFFHTSKIERPILSYWITCICVAQGKFENQDLITVVKAISAFINDWGNIAYWAIPEKHKQGVEDILF